MRKRISGKARFVRNGRSLRVALLVPNRTRLMDDGTPVASYILHRPGGRSLMTADELAESHWDDCGRSAFEAAWQAEAAELATRPHTEHFYLATGRLLPIWNLLGDDAQVRRLVTQDGRSLLGRIVPADAVNTLLDKLGLGDRIALSADQLVEAALSGKVAPIDNAGGLSLKRSRVNGEQRLESLLFWNNATGFGALVGATIFNEVEAAKASLPVGVDRLEWLELPAVPSEQGSEP